VGIPLTLIAGKNMLKEALLFIFPRRKTMPKSKRTKRASSGVFTAYSEKSMSPVVKFGIIFFWVAVIAVVAYAGKYYL
jgi:hypothetical protein